MRAVVAASLRRLADQAALGAPRSGSAPLSGKYSSCYAFGAGGVSAFDISSCCCSSSWSPNPSVCDPTGIPPNQRGPTTRSGDRTQWGLSEGMGFGAGIAGVAKVASSTREKSVAMRSSSPIEGKATACRALRSRTRLLRDRAESSGV